MLIARSAKMISFGLMVLAASIASGQNFPTKPIRIVTVEAGGSGDFGSRVIGEAVSRNVGQQVIVENRPSGVIPGDIVAKASPDGYTVTYNGLSFWLLPFFQANVPWDPVKDFSPITLVGNSPNIIVVHPAVPAKSIKELIALAKANPGQLNYGSSGTGSSGHLAGELLKAMAGIDMLHIAFKGAGPALNSLLGGELQLSFTGTASVSPLLKAGKLRSLAVTSLQPSALLPGLPTVAAVVPGYRSGSTYGMFAPAKTPAAIINRLNQEIVRALNQAEVKEQFFSRGVEIVGSSPEQFAATLKSDLATLGKVIKDIGIRPQ